MTFLSDGFVGLPFEVYVGNTPLKESSGAEIPNGKFNAHTKSYQRLLAPPPPDRPPPQLPPRDELLPELELLIDELRVNCAIV
jgi:hypothetical protein